MSKFLIVEEYLNEDIFSIIIEAVSLTAAKRIATKSQKGYDSVITIVSEDGTRLAQKVRNKW